MGKRRLTARCACVAVRRVALPHMCVVVYVSERLFLPVQAKIKELRAKYDKTEDDLKVGGRVRKAERATDALEHRRCRAWDR